MDCSPLSEPKGLSALPPELLLRIVGFLPPRGIVRLSSQSKNLLHLCRSDDVWRPICRAIVSEWSWTLPEERGHGRVVMGFDEAWQDTARKSRDCTGADWSIDPWEQVEHGLGVQGWYQLASEFLIPHRRFLGWHSSSRPYHGRLVLTTLCPRTGQLTMRVIEAFNAYHWANYSATPPPMPAAMPPPPIAPWFANESIRSLPLADYKDSPSRPRPPPLPSTFQLVNQGDGYVLPLDHPSPYRKYDHELFKPVYCATTLLTCVPWRLGARLGAASHSRPGVGPLPWAFSSGMRVDLRWENERPTPLEGEEADRWRIAYKKWERERNRRPEGDPQPLEPMSAESAAEMVGWEGQRRRSERSRGGLTPSEETLPAYPSWRLLDSLALRPARDDNGEWTFAGEAVLPSRSPVVPRLDASHGQAAVVSQAWGVVPYVSPARGRSADRTEPPTSGSSAHAAVDPNRGNIRYQTAPASRPTARTRIVYGNGSATGGSLFGQIVDAFRPRASTSADDDRFGTAADRSPSPPPPEPFERYHPICGPTPSFCAVSGPPPQVFKLGDPIPAVSLEESLWVGSYGPHGCEFGKVVVVQRQVKVHSADEVELYHPDGFWAQEALVSGPLGGGGSASRESDDGAGRAPGPIGRSRTTERWCLEYTKLTGDENVPAGAPSWTAYLASPTTLETIHLGTSTETTKDDVEVPHVPVETLDGWVFGDASTFGEPDWSRGRVEAQGRLAFSAYRYPRWSDATVTFVSHPSPGGGTGGGVFVDEIRMAWKELEKVSVFRRVRF